MVKTESLLTVKTLSRSHAKQIEALKYDPSPESLWSRIRKALESGEIVPIGFVRSTVLRDIGVSNPPIQTAWLVKFENRFWWAPAPERGPALERNPAVEQLFV